jgi:pimeloyl-ACP methyl ester carboxylesterase
MPMVVSRNQRIFFRYEGERGAYLLLHHGLFGSHQDWYRAGYVEELAKEFRLVIPDARGHGRSDKPAEKEQYQLSLLVDDLIEVMNNLAIRNLHFLGYSFGAVIGFEMLRRYPERVRIAVLGGEAPVVVPAVREHWRGLLEKLRTGPAANVLAGLRTEGQLERLDQRPVDEAEALALPALLEAMTEWDLAGEERLSVTSPITVFSGNNDPAAARVETARATIHRARLVTFPGLGHSRLIEERTQLTEEVLRLLKAGRRGEEAEGPRRGSGDADGGQGMAGSGGQEGRRPDRQGNGRSRRDPRRGSWGAGPGEGRRPSAPAQQGRPDADPVPEAARPPAPAEPQAVASPAEAPQPATPQDTGATDTQEIQSAAGEPPAGAEQKDKRDEA